MENTKIIIQKKKLSEMTDEEINVTKYRALERRYNSVIIACKSVENQNELFRRELEISHKKLENAQLSVDINKKIVLNVLTESNAKKDLYISEIASLKLKLKEG